MYVVFAKNTRIIPVQLSAYRGRKKTMYHIIPAIGVRTLVRRYHFCPARKNARKTVHPNPHVHDKRDCLVGIECLLFTCWRHSYRLQSPLPFKGVSTACYGIFLGGVLHVHHLSFLAAPFPIQFLFSHETTKLRPILPAHETNVGRQEKVP